MNREELLELVKNAKTKTELLEKLNFSKNGRGTKMLILLCDKKEIDFELEFGSNITKHNECKYCRSKIPLKNKFCNSSCAAKFNNSERIVSDESKQKRSKTLKDKYLSGELIPNYNKTDMCYNSNFGVITSTNYDMINKNYKYVCKNCGKDYVLDVFPSKARKTCSRECQTKMIFKNRTYQNGSRKTIYYYNTFINSIVVLESSWELKVAELLDEKNIKWVRPSSLTWIDGLGNHRQYYPDFYLTEHDLYLDPKNIYCMGLDKDKLEYIEKNVNIKYGDINYILYEINKL
jgi:predicted nucleic acid-binding Zn ribbon protein